MPPVIGELYLTWALHQLGFQWGRSSGSEKHGSIAVNRALSAYKNPQLGPGILVEMLMTYPGKSLRSGSQPPEQFVCPFGSMQGGLRHTQRFMLMKETQAF